jgi:glyoxylase-like metal-dependent hydrolase (beta-lactamase superfamily II)
VNIKELSPKPVVRIVNTHTHGDHVSGNVEFPTTVEVVAHENTAANMKEMRPLNPPKPGAPPPANIFKDNNGRGLAKRTFTDRMTIGKGPDQVDLYYFGRGHTNGDAWVLFPALRVVHSGDIFANKGLPILDAANGGSGVEMPETLTKAADTLAKNTAETIITGHAQTTMTLADLREWAEFNRDSLNTVREGKKTGRSVDDIAGAYKIPAKFTGYNMPQPARVKANVQVTFDEIR